MYMKFDDKKVEVLQAVKYLFVGGSSAVLELVIFQLLYKCVLLDVVVSNILAIILATIYNFTLNRGFAFRSSTNMARSIALYLVLFCVNSAFSSGMVFLFQENSLPVFFGKIIAMCCTVSWNYYLYRNIIFK